MMAQAGFEVMNEVGVGPADVDGVFATSGPGAIELAEYMGIQPEFVDATQLGGASSVAHIADAARLINGGEADVILVAHSGRNRSARDAGTPPTVGIWSEEYQVPFGVPAPMGLMAMNARAHMDRYGTTSEQFAEVAVGARHWSRMNPEALRRDLITVDDVLSSPQIAEPLHQLDCCLLTDAAGAILVCSESVAAQSPAPVRIAGSGQAHSHILATQWDRPERSAAGVALERALHRADVGRSDVDVLQLYDVTTSQVVIMLEDLGFCLEGEGGSFVQSGALRPGGSLPTNTQGGALAFTHPGAFGIFTAIEAYRQLSGAYRGTERQVDGAEVAVAHAIGLAASSHASLVLVGGGR